MNLLENFKEEMKERIPCMGQANLIIPNNNDQHMVMQNEVAELKVIWWLIIWSSIHLVLQFGL